MTHSLPFASKLVHNVGLIVLESQELERHLKLVVAASEHGATASVAERHEKLKRRSLGVVVKRLLGNATVTEGSAEDLESYFHSLLDRRNSVVHHFFEYYAADLEAGRHSEILASLAALHRELREVAGSFKSVNEALFDMLQKEQPLVR